VSGLMVFFAVMNRRGSMCMRGLFVELGCSLVRIFRHLAYLSSVSWE
jgi:hypothetical protein